jgi:hypothetical protein
MPAAIASCTPLLGAVSASLVPTIMTDIISRFCSKNGDDEMQKMKSQAAANNVMTSMKAKMSTMIRERRAAVPFESSRTFAFCSHDGTKASVQV